MVKGLLSKEPNLSINGALLEIVANECLSRLGVIVQHCPQSSNVIAHKLAKVGQSLLNDVVRKKTSSCIGRSSFGLDAVSW